MESDYKILKWVSSMLLLAFLFVLLFVLSLFCDFNYLIEVEMLRHTCSLGGARTTGTSSSWYWTQA